ncbi:MAG TPA: hypothetical protein VLK29_12335, partial [Luteimonas sp.]|nr:hypothetical protein [Luteimonas sp.]
MSDTTLLVTVLGSEEWLHFESSEHLQPAVRVTFTATSAPDPPDAAPPEPVTWSEQLAAEPVAGPVADGAAATMRIRWVVAFAPQATAPPRFELTYKVEGVGQSSRSPAFAVERERLLVDSIGVATIPALTNIMLHEFARPAADPPGPDTRPEFDPGPAQSYIRGLSPQQQKFLLRYDVGRFGGNRLVVFITLDTGTGRRMCADYCEDAPTRVSANSSFAVFHCRGPGKGATLVCFTAHFLVNTHNPSTASLLRAHDGDRGPNQWMAKDTDRPVMFKIGCCAPSAASH